MTTKAATPLRIIESYFGTELDKSGTKHLMGIADESKWVDFALHYLHTMRANFVADFLEVEDDKQAPNRLYFEPRLRQEWDAAAAGLNWSPSPLLGVTPDPASGDLNAAAAAEILGPLKKHLLIADSVYIRDSFYYSFDLIEGCVTAAGWRDDPNLAGQVSFGISRLKAWLPLLRELRRLVETQALVFMPYYLMPSWPYETGAKPPSKEAFASLRTRPAPGPAQPGPAWFGEREVEGAWLNARLLGLDPVFPNRRMFDFASRLYLAGDEEPGDLTCDLTSLDIVPLGEKKPISVETLLSLRKNEEGFAAVRGAVTDCQASLRDWVVDGVPRSAAAASCRELFDERIAGYAGKKGKVIGFAERPIPSVVFTAAIAAALIPLAAINPFIPVAAGAAATPGLARLVQRRFNPRLKAMTSLKALL